MSSKPSSLLNRNIKIWIIFIFVIILIIMMLIYFLNIGRILVVDDIYEKADYIVVLMGSLLDRTLHATDLYHQRKGAQIVVIRENMVGKRYIEERGIEVSTNADHARKIAYDLGVPDDSIIILDGEADNTQEEAIIIKEYLEQISMTSTKESISIAIVTSKYHSYRAKQVFSKVLNKNVQGNEIKPQIIIYSSPTAYDSFNPDQWWKSRSDTRSVIFETLKLMHFYLREQFQL